MSRLHTYYRLTKPGIIRGNAIAAIGGFLLASEGSINLALFVAMLAGTSLVIASACVFNNYLDRHIDKHMKRTQNRALVTGEVSTWAALTYASLLGIAGFAVLIVFTNILTAALGAIGMFFYVVVYGYSKRTSIHGTLVGSISGSIPPVAGYTAVTNQIDTAAVLLFLILAAWQMPHFYAIAVFRLKEYAAANIPVLPLKRSMKRTKIEIVLYIGLFAILSSLLTLTGYTGYVYAIVMVVVSLLWLRLSINGFHAGDENKWARKVFGYSLLILLLFSLLISIDAYLP